MDIKILDQNEMFNDANKSISVYDINYNELENDLFDNDNNESMNEPNNVDLEIFG